MIKVGWARPDSTFRRVFTQLMIPDASEEQAGWLDDLQPLATSTDNAMRSRAARVTADVSTLLPDVAMPTLVVHARGDRMMDFSEARELASCIPHARLVTLDSDNHITLADEPSWPVVVEECGWSGRDATMRSSRRSFRCRCAPSSGTSPASTPSSASLADLRGRQRSPACSAADLCVSAAIAAATSSRMSAVSTDSANLCRP